MNLLNSVNIVRLLSGMMMLGCVSGTSLAQMARLPLPLERSAEVLDQTLKSPVRSGEDGGLVHVLAFNGEIYPPELNGRPHTNNPILFSTIVGAGVDPIQMPGTFMASIIPRPSAPFFVRVYNASTTEEATFYEDSDVHEPVDNIDIAHYPVMTATTNAIDPGDDDNDGIHNSWEQSVGLNMNSTDSDGDGMGDALEVTMGTDPRNANSVVPPFVIGRSSGRTLVADWDLDAPADEYVPKALQESLSSSISVNSDPYAGFVYKVQASDGLPGIWRDLGEGVVGEWPANHPMPESTNAVQIYRVIMEINP